MILLHTTKIIQSEPQSEGIKQRIITSKFGEQTMHGVAE